MTSECDSLVRMMSKDTHVEAYSLPMQNEDLHTSTNGAKGSAKSSSNYTRKEDIQLCISWQSISSDPVIGNEQPGKAYWQRIAEHCHANRDFESDRNANSLEHHWGNIQKEVSKFQGCHDQIERRHPYHIKSLFLKPRRCTHPMHQRIGHFSLITVDSS